MRGAGYVLKPAGVTDDARCCPPRSPAGWSRPLVAVVAGLDLLVTVVDRARDAQLPQRPARPRGRRGPRPVAGPVRRRLRHAAAAGRAAGDGDGDNRRPTFGLGDAEGTLNAQFGTGVTTLGGVRHQRRPHAAPLSTAALQDLRGVAADGHSHAWTCRASAHYRRRRRAGAATVAWSSPGCPPPTSTTRVANLIGLELLLALAGVAAAAAPALVRRTPPAPAAARGRRHRPRRSPRCRWPAATSSSPSGCPSGSPTSAPRSARSARRSTPCSPTSSRPSTRGTRSEQQVRQFVADASHELRTPLTTIHGYAELSPAPARRPGARCHAP